MAAFGVKTDIGRQKANNEDHYLALPEQKLWLVADGLGGYAAGDIASEIVCESVAEVIHNGSSLVDSLQLAHDAVIEAGQAGRGVPGMGSTAVALQLSEDRYEVAWVGDSRAYMYNDQRIVQLTCDHSLVENLVKARSITKEEARVHPHRHLITQCIGSLQLEKVRVDVVRGHLLEHARFLLCSDGLNDELNDNEIAQILHEQKHAQIAAEHLVERAVAKGGRDNITAMVIDVSPPPSWRWLKSRFWFFPAFTLFALLTLAFFGA